MSEVLLTILCVYLWLVGGIFISIAAADGDFGGVPRKNIELLVIGWPALTLYAFAIVFGQDATFKVKRFWRFVRER